MSFDDCSERCGVLKRNLEQCDTLFLFDISFLFVFLPHRTLAVSVSSMFDLCLSILLAGIAFL